MKVACLTAIYSGMAQYIEEYIMCVQHQTTSSFDLVLVNDNFPQAIEQYTEHLKVDVKELKCSKTPLENRLHGLEYCRNAKYDIVICSDSDDTMEKDRVEKVLAYFNRYPEKIFVYNNSVGYLGSSHFDLFYKKHIELTDILDFNILGYGALNFTAEFIPFILSNVNTDVLSYDWWFALVSLLHYKKVDFLKDVKNNYRLHSGNFIGPVFDINEKRVLFGIEVKKDLYTQMMKYCRENGFKNEEHLFFKKRNEIEGIEAFILKTSLTDYVTLLKDFFSKKEKLFWYEDVVSLTNLRSMRNEGN